MDKIGPAADVYGLGALFYYKLMGDCPGRKERGRGAKFDFYLLQRENPLCRPLLFKRLGQSMREQSVRRKSMRGKNAGMKDMRTKNTR